MSVPAPIAKRKPLSRKEYLHLILQQEGKCGCGCGVKLDPMGEGVIDEHVIPREFRHDGADDLSNRALWRKPCSAEKTKRDMGDIARAKRRAGETCTGPSKPIPQRANAWPPKGSRKIQSRGFQNSRRQGGEA